MPEAAAAAVEQEHAEALVRLGESPEWGELLLQLLELSGWTVYRRRAFAGNGVLLLAAHPSGYEVSVEGPSVAAAASPLFEQCAWIRPPKDDQLALPL